MRFSASAGTRGPTRSSRRSEGSRESITRTSTRAIECPRLASRRSTRLTRCSRTRRSARSTIATATSGFEQGHGGDYGGFGDFGGISDIFDMFFGAAGAGGATRTRSAAERGNDLRYDVELTLEEAAHGVSRSIKMSRMETCETCGGSGAKPGSHPGDLRGMSRRRAGSAAGAELLRNPDQNHRLPQMPR